MTHIFFSLPPFCLLSRSIFVSHQILPPVSRWLVIMMADSSQESHAASRSTKRPAENELSADGPSQKRPYRAPFPFFTLPKELRDDIYSLALASERASTDVLNLYNFDLPGLGLVAYASGDPLTEARYCPKPCLPSWVSASKQIQEEAIKVFARDKIFQVRHGYPLIQTAPGVHDQDTSHRTRTLLQSIRTLKVSFTKEGTSKRFCLVPQRNLEAFLKLRGTLRSLQNLLVSWNYLLFDMHDMYPIIDPLEEPMKWPTRLPKVTVTVNFTDRSEGILTSTKIGSHPVLLLGEEHALSVATAKDQIYKTAETWARGVFETKDTTCKVGEETTRTISERYTMYSRTMEVVDHETKHALQGSK
jgi:hypothetical protein